MEKYLIVGLGNPGKEYKGTRHNVGFMVLDAFAKASNIVYKDKRYGYITSTVIDDKEVFLLKPTTFMNLSGNAVVYWMKKQNIDQKNLLIIVDDIALPVGKLRLRAAGSNGGHNGLGSIQQNIGTQYARLRIGIGDDFAVGAQIGWVLGHFNGDELIYISRAVDESVEIIKCFVTEGLDVAMNKYNHR